MSRIISRNATGKYHISILLEREQNEVTPALVDESQTIAGDLGISHFLTLSDGSKIGQSQISANFFSEVEKIDRFAPSSKTCTHYQLNEPEFVLVREVQRYR